MDIEIDASDAFRTATAFRQGPAIANDELRIGMQRSVHAVLGQSMKNTPVITGHLRRGQTSEVRGAGGTLIGVVGTNVPYARAVHDGRGPVEARPGGVLRFVIRGKVLYRKRVGPAKANPFMRNALAQMRPTIHKEFALVAGRIAKRIANL